MLWIDDLRLSRQSADHLLKDAYKPPISIWLQLDQFKYVKNYREVHVVRETCITIYVKRNLQVIETLKKNI